MAHEPTPADSNSDPHRNIFSTGVAECLVDPDRRVIVHGLGQTGGPESISEARCYQACSRAHPMRVRYQQNKAGDLPHERSALGQVGFIHKGKLVGSPGSKTHYEVIPITAKHNLRKIENEDHELYPADAKGATVLSRVDLSSRILSFDDLNVSVLDSNILLRECSLANAEWGFGIDISLGRPVTSRAEGITNELSTFEFVSEKYEFVKGQKVGIAVLNILAPTRKTASHDPSVPLDLKPGQLKEIYGAEMVAKVYTGKITVVGEHHIEYDINSFEGCSGAIVFLLDEDQHESVSKEDYGGAIAVHAGTHPILTDRNIWFKLTKDMLS